MVAFHSRTKRWAVLVCHRAFGKTWGVINDLIVRCLACNTASPRFFYVAPYRVQAKAIAWDALKHFSDSIPGHKFNESELSVTFDGDRKITLFGADNFNSLRGLHFDGGVIDESEQISKEAIDYVLNFCLIQKQGWLVEIGTIKGSKGLYAKWDKARTDPDYFTMFIPAGTSGVIPPHELDRLKRKNPVAYAREMDLDPNAEISGSIYGRQMSDLRANNRIKPMVLDSRVPLYTFWDLGQRDYTAIWLMQLVGRDLVCLDYYCNHGFTAGHYAGKILQWEAQYGRIRLHYLPHDAASAAGGGLSWVENLELAGLRNTEIVNMTRDVWLGIHELRELLPRFYIDQQKCGAGSTWLLDAIEMPSGIDCLDYYRCKEEVKSGIPRDEPVHDQFSHGADALRTFAEAYAAGQIEEVRGEFKPVSVKFGPRQDAYGTGAPMQINTGGNPPRYMTDPYDFPHPVPAVKKGPFYVSK
jgi:hypothetical protein